MHTTLFGNAVDAFFKLEESNNQPSYIQSEILKKASTGILSRKLDESSVKILMTSRGTMQKEDGTYIINRDSRLRVIPIHSMFSQDQLDEYANLIT